MTGTREIRHTLLGRSCARDYERRSSLQGDQWLLGTVLAQQAESRIARLESTVQGWWRRWKPRG
ncbi:hypothetical protein LINPERPRIM_LOCUS9318 [Linum perenne]